MFDSHAEAGPKQQDILQPSCIYHSSITESQAPPTHEITKRDVRVTEKQEGRLGRVTEPLCESSETEKVTLINYAINCKFPAREASFITHNSQWQNMKVLSRWSWRRSDMGHTLCLSSAPSFVYHLFILFSFHYGLYSNRLLNHRQRSSAHITADESHTDG